MNVLPAGLCFKSPPAGGAAALKRAFHTGDVPHPDNLFPFVSGEEPQRSLGGEADCLSRKLLPPRMDRYPLVKNGRKRFEFRKKGREALCEETVVVRLELPQVGGEHFLPFHRLPALHGQ